MERAAGIDEGAIQMNLEDVSTFLDQNGTCVLATLGSDNQPMAATVGFSHRPDFSIIIATNKKTRKYQNLKNNPKVAIVVSVTAPKTVQYEGIAKELTAEELGERLEQHFKKVPMAKKMAGESGQSYFVITPTWLRLTDYSTPNPIFETKDFS